MKQRIFSGIQPSGNLHIGNYLGAIKNWVKLQNEYDSIFCVVDLHAITVPQDPEQLRKKTIEIAKIYLAAGIDPKKATIFIQSHVSEHTELMWILNTITRNGELSRMTQFKSKANLNFDDLDRLVNDLEIISTKIKSYQQNAKDLAPISKGSLILPIDGLISDFIKKVDEIKSIKNQFNKIDVGLFDYPVLMAADILLYDTELVPVGRDQLQHIELTRDLANRFNKKFGDTFKVPKGYTTEESQNIMGLDDPTKKMSKSAKSEYNYISLVDDADTVRKKIKKAVTDSGSEIIYQDDKPALKNLINIYSLLADISTKDVEKKFKGKGYADFKTDLADEVVTFLRPFQEKIQEYSDDKVLEILHEGAERVRPIAKKKLEEVKEKIGFIL